MKYIGTLFALATILTLNGCGPTSSVAPKPVGSVVFERWGTITYDPYTGAHWSNGYVINNGSSTVHNVHVNGIPVLPYALNSGSEASFEQSAVGSGGGFNNPAIYSITWNEQ
jgi:hypothetical protein